MSSPVKAREWEKSLTVKCRLCGGAKCKRCSESAALAKGDSPVIGLHADMVAGRLLGMMRPSTRLIKEYQIIPQFHKLHITAVFNLTLPGEHPYCGDGLGVSGFPYDPEKDLMVEKIGFYNFGWEDMTTPTLPMMLDIVKVMASILENGHNKVAVHCHAGYGRTGLAIACCLLFLHNNIPPNRAIAIVRRDRPGSIQTSAQAKFVHSFHEFVRTSSVVFALPYIYDRFSLAEVIEHQNRMGHGEHCAGVRRALPRIVDFLCHELERTLTSNESEEDATQVLHGFLSHLPWQPHDGRSPVTDLVELQERHFRVVYGDIGSASAVINPLTASQPVPPPVPASLGTCPHQCLSSEDLFPVKVAFNVGELNWTRAMARCPSPLFGPALLLDWLEHLATPLLPHEVVAHTNATEAASLRWKSVNQLPVFVVKSLDRILAVVRLLVRQTERVNAPALAQAVSVRTAMALFQLTSSTPASTLFLHAEFVHQLLHDWKPSKRLELNLDSLQRMGSSHSQRHLLHLSASSKPLLSQDEDPNLQPEANESNLDNGSSASPTKAAGYPSIEPMPSKHMARPRLLSGEQSSATTATNSPSYGRTVERERPTTPQCKEGGGESSPVKTDSLIPRLVGLDIRFERRDPASPRNTAEESPKKHLRGSLESPRAIDHGPSSPQPQSAPPIAPLRGAASQSNEHSLPSVRVSERYKNRS